MGKRAKEKKFIKLRAFDFRLCIGLTRLKYIFLMRDSKLVGCDFGSCLFFLLAIASTSQMKLKAETQAAASGAVRCLFPLHIHIYQYLYLYLYLCSDQLVGSALFTRPTRQVYSFGHGYSYGQLYGHRVVRNRNLEERATDKPKQRAGAAELMPQLDMFMTRLFGRSAMEISSVSWLLCSHSIINLLCNQCYIVLSTKHAVISAEMSRSYHVNMS